MLDGFVLLLWEAVIQGGISVPGEPGLVKMATGGCVRLPEVTGHGLISLSPLFSSPLPVVVWILFACELLRHQGLVRETWEQGVASTASGTFSERRKGHRQDVLRPGLLCCYSSAGRALISNERRATWGGGRSRSYEHYLQCWHDHLQVGHNEAEGCMRSRERTQRKMQFTAASEADTLASAPKEDSHFGISLLA